MGLNQKINRSLTVLAMSLFLIVPSVQGAGEKLESIPITNVGSGDSDSGGPSSKRRVTNARDLMRVMPASLKPKSGNDWTREDIQRIGNWLSTKKGTPFQATLEIKKVEIGEASFGEKRDYKNDNLWKVVFFFESRKLSYLGVTLEETVNPVSVFGNENYSRAAQRLRIGSRVRVKGNVNRFGLRSDSVSAKLELLTIYLEDADVISSSLPKTLLKIGASAERHAPAPGWTGRQKSGNFWTKSDIEAFKPNVEKGVLGITHTQEAGGYLTFDKRILSGDFTIQVVVHGEGRVGIIDTSTIDASDFSVAINSKDPVKIRINRTGKHITFTVDGKDKTPRQGQRADAETPQLFFAAVSKDELLHLHLVEMSK